MKQDLLDSGAGTAKGDAKLLYEIDKVAGWQCDCMHACASACMQRLQVRAGRIDTHVCSQHT